MKDDEKIFGAFRQAADREPQDAFPAMEKVWRRVEEKLDRRELRHGMDRWKKLAIAASVLLLCSLAYFLTADREPAKQQVVIALPETEPAEIQVLPLPNKRDSAKIIILEPRRAIVQSATPEVIAPASEAVANRPFSIPSEPEQSFVQPEAIPEPEAVAAENMGSQVEMAVAEPKKAAPVKSEPLLIVDGKAVAGKNYSEGKNVSADEETETIVLDEPLYIINGVHYTEEEMFGPNPTSPYAPLNRQEIESVKVLHGKEATAAYGEKGKKGVLIIKTKDGKPASPLRVKTR